MTAVLFGVAGLAAVLDWLAVWRRLFRVEYVAKPLTLALLIAATVSADLPGTKVWVVAALACGLAGDVALMLGKDEPGQIDGWFLSGIAAFLAGHVCYLVAFARYGLHGLQLVAGGLIVLGVAAMSMPRVLGAAQRSAGREVAAVLNVYSLGLGAMTVLAVGTGAAATAVGGVLFLVSDTVIAWERFVGRIRRGAVVVGPVLVIVTYHLAQFLIVLGLIRH